MRVGNELHMLPSSATSSVRRDLAPLLLVAACHPAVKSTLPGPPTRSQTRAVVGRAGAPVATSIWGVGGKALAPDPAATYTVIEIKRTGFSPGYTVAGPDKRQWSAKFPPEAPTEVVASRIHWGLGYHQPPIYYLAKWQAEKTTSPNPQLPARFREKNPALHGGLEETGTWSVLSESLRRHAPAQGPDRAAGDARQLGSQGRQQRDSTRSASRSKARGPGMSPATWGTPSAAPASSSAPRGDIEVFEKTPFITGVVNGRVTFDWRGRHDALFDDITPADVRWICGRLQRLRDAQWRDAFRAGGYPPARCRTVQFRPAEAEDSPQGLARPGLVRACLPLQRTQRRDRRAAGNHATAARSRAAAGGGRSGTALALRPRRKGTPPRTPAVVQTQIILAVVGAIIMLVVGAEPGARVRHRRRRQPDSVPIEDRRPEGRRGDALRARGRPGRQASGCTRSPLLDRVPGRRCSASSNRSRRA